MDVSDSNTSRALVLVRIEPLNGYWYMLPSHVGTSRQGTMRVFIIIYIIYIYIRLPFGMYVTWNPGASQGEKGITGSTRIAVLGGNVRHGLANCSKKTVKVVSRNWVLLFLRELVHYMHAVPWIDYYTVTIYRTHYYADVKQAEAARTQQNTTWYTTINTTITNYKQYH